MITVKTSNLFEAVQALIVAGESPCLIGPSGIGKTQIVGQVAEKLGYELVPVHLMSMAPEDAKFPIVDPVNNEVTFVPAKMFMKGARPKLFFWDELTHASTVLQSLCYQVFEGGRLGDYKLPEDARHIAAHNRIADKGVHNRVPVPLRRRWFELLVEPFIGESGDGGWWDWATVNDVDPLIMGFLKWRPQFFYEDCTSDALAPDPRAWVKISNLISTCPNLPIDVLHALVAGKVGEGVAAEFTAYLRLYRDLPDLDAILAAPDRAPIPSNIAALYAVVCAISRRMSVKNIGACIKYLNRVTVNGRTAPEFGVLAMKDALLRDRALTSTPELTKWALANQDVVL